MSNSEKNNNANLRLVNVRRIPKSELEELIRWEDDGGMPVELGNYLIVEDENNSNSDSSTLKVSIAIKSAG